jgi:hypothetical protein
MKPPRSPEFLARESYRMRRLMDAARLLPIFGLMLFLLPILRHSPDAEAPPTGAEAVYLFAIWAILIGLALVLSLVLRRALGDRPRLSTLPEDITRGPLTPRPPKGTAR